MVFDCILNVLKAIRGIPPQFNRIESSATFGPHFNIPKHTKPLDTRVQRQFDML